MFSSYSHWIRTEGTQVVGIIANTVWVYFAKLVTAASVIMESQFLYEILETIEKPTVTINHSPYS